MLACYGAFRSMGQGGPPLFGYDAEEAVGQPFDLIVTEADIQ
jgi:hypothetical protein